MSAESRLREADLELQRIRHDLRNHRRALQRRSRPLFTAYQAEFALRVYCLSHYDLDAAVACLANLCQKRQHAECAPDESQRRELVETSFLTVDATVAAEMAVWERNPGTQCARSAQKAFLEYRLMLWVRSENVAKGHAPSTDMVLEYRRRLAAEWVRSSSQPSAMEPGAPDGHCYEETSTRAWAWRFRRRWGGRVARIRMREPMAEELALQKADRKPPEITPLGQERGTLFGTSKRPQNESHQYRICSAGRPECGPKKSPTK